MTKRARLTLREQEYRDAVAKLQAAERAVLLWADSVSADVERRLGVGPEDLRRHDEPEYAQALTIAGHVIDAHAMLRAAQLPKATNGGGGNA